MSKEVIYEAPDISKHNGNVNVKRVRDAGYRRICIRAGYGNNNVDEMYVANALACANLGVQVMVYWFSYAYSTEMAAAEAKYCIAQAEKYWKQIPICFDFEYDSVNYARKKGIEITMESCTDMAIAFLETVKAAGHIPVIYTNKDYMTHYFDMKRISKTLETVYVWYARYTNSISNEELALADIWQYTSAGSIHGISGKVDLSKFYTDLWKETKPVPRQPKCNLNIKNFQHAAGVDGYRDPAGNQLIEDGIDGPKTQYVRGQINLKAKRTIFGYRAGSIGAVVRWWQGRCNEILGHNQKVDGIYGKKSRSETILLQKKLGLTTDGVAGYNSIQTVFYN